MAVTLPQKSLGDSNYSSMLELAEDKSLPQDIRTRIDIWCQRYLFYQGLEAYGLSSYGACYQKKYPKLSKLQAALKALKNLDLDANPHNDLPREILLQIISVEIYKFEFTQLHALQNIQNIKRAELTEKLKLLEEGRKNIREKIATQKVKLYDYIHDEHPIAQAYFRERENKFRFSSHIHQSEKVADAAETVGDISQIVVSASHITSNFLTSLFKVASILLQSIPIVSTATSAIPLLLNAYKAFKKNESAARKVTTGLGALAAIGVIIATGLAPPAATMLAIGLLGWVIADTYLVPWGNLRKQVYKKNKEIKAIDLRNQELTHTTISKLDEREKHILLSKIEELWLNTKDPDKKSLDNTRKFLNDGELFSANDDHSLLISYIAGENEKYKNSLNDDISQLKKKERKIAFASANSLIGIAGFVMLLFPPTLIPGAAIIAATTIVNIGIKYNLKKLTIANILIGTACGVMMLFPPTLIPGMVLLAATAVFNAGKYFQIGEMVKESFNSIWGSKHKALPDKTSSRNHSPSLTSTPRITLALCKGDIEKAKNSVTPPLTATTGKVKTYHALQFIAQDYSPPEPPRTKSLLAK